MITKEGLQITQSIKPTIMVISLSGHYHLSSWDPWQRGKGGQGSKGGQGGRGGRGGEEGGGGGVG